MRIGELARIASVSCDSLRFYERLGLIASRRAANGYRDYPAAAAQRVLYIKTAQRLGFSLAEVGANLAGVERAADPDTAVRLLLGDKLARVDQQIEALQHLREELRGRLGSDCPLRREDALA
ncbi:MerR family transcriptional regulator [Pseudomonas sp. RIT-PI-AD]|uniref:MerR family transcriptional regulator n=1 Tax=Pseudomonas sp. RIT-PI-AD TaxID=3035294 RepID=UPI0021D8E0E8|nr:MerR family transcriptional regulator [Pseudomonas sp. RIT-PI-AD]